MGVCCLHGVSVDTVALAVVVVVRRLFITDPNQAFHLPTKRWSHITNEETVAHATPAYLPHHAVTRTLNPNPHSNPITLTLTL